jgi:hypothetical protein
MLSGFEFFFIQDLTLHGLAVKKWKTLAIFPPAWSFPFCSESPIIKIKVKHKQRNLYK